MLRVNRGVAVTLGAWLLSGCTLVHANQPQAGARLRTEAAKGFRTVQMTARLAITPHRTLLGVVSPWGPADIDHVRLELFQGVTSKGTLTITQAQLGGVVRINNLAPSTSYTVQARAWQDAGETVPIDNFDVSAASCTTAFSTTGDDVLSLSGGIALRLRDRTFSGLGTGAIAVTPGNVVAAGPEGLALYVNAGTVSTLAGLLAGYSDGSASAALFNGPTGVAADTSGNVYVSDGGNHVIRKISATGAVTTFAGSVAGYADGTGSAARFNIPRGLALDAGGNLYVADRGNFCVRRITPTGVVTTLAGPGVGAADGTGAAAQFRDPSGVAVDGAGNVYVADEGNHRIRKITSAGVVTTLAGSSYGSADGAGAAAMFWHPSAVAVDGGGTVYVMDRINATVRKVSATGVVSTLAGGITNGYGITVDPARNVYVADQGSDRIYKITPAGVMSILAGGGQGYAEGTGLTARFFYPFGIAIDTAGTLYVADQANHRVRKIQ